MQIDELVDALTYHRGRFPHAAVAEAVKRREEITPALLDILAQTDAYANSEYPPDDFMGHLMACYLLAQFRETRAYRPIVALFTPTREIIEELFGDFTTEALPRVLASVCDGDTEPLMGMIKDTATDRYVRGAALRALSVLVAQGEMARDELMAIIISLFHGGLEQTQSGIWDDLIDVACDIHPREVMDEIRHTYAVGWADPSFVGMDWVEESLAAGQERQLFKLARDHHHQYIKDTDVEFSAWAWFQPEYWPEAIRPKQERKAESRAKAEPEAEPAAQVVAAPASGAKPGRNDPCPCGSGIKFKHCCGKKA